eukprot:scaffold125342_cov23-Tisochrysis_lutea.AAC.1
MCALNERQCHPCCCMPALAGRECCAGLWVGNMQRRTQSRWHAHGGPALGACAQHPHDALRRWVWKKGPQVQGPGRHMHATVGTAQTWYPNIVFLHSSSMPLCAPLCLVCMFDTHTYTPCGTAWKVFAWPSSAVPWKPAGAPRLFFFAVCALLQVPLHPLAAFGLPDCSAFFK